VREIFGYKFNMPPAAMAKHKSKTLLNGHVAVVKTSANRNLLFAFLYLLNV